MSVDGDIEFEYDGFNPGTINLVEAGDGEWAASLQTGGDAFGGVKPAETINITQDDDWEFGMDHRFSRANNTQKEFFGGGVGCVIRPNYYGDDDDLIYLYFPDSSSYLSYTGAFLDGGRVTQKVTSVRSGATNTTSVYWGTDLVAQDVDNHTFTTTLDFFLNQLNGNLFSFYFKLNGVMVTDAIVTGKGYFDSVSGTYLSYDNEPEQNPPIFTHYETNYDLEADKGLWTAVNISLFTNARVPDDEVPLGMVNQGFPGDVLNTESIGSKWWTLGRSKLNSETETLMINYTRSALNWMIVDEVVASIDVTSVRTGNVLEITVVLHRSGDASISNKYSLNWDNMNKGT